MVAYQKAAQAFGDDNFVFIAYDDPRLLTPDGMDRVARLAEAVGPAQIGGVLRVESLDAMPLLWTIDDLLLVLERLPAFWRSRALRSGATARQGPRRQNEPIDGRRRGPRGEGRPGSPGRAQGPSDPPPPVSRHGDRRLGDDDRRRRPPEEDRAAQGRGDDRCAAAGGRSVRGRPPPGPTRCGRAAGAAGRRLREHRARRPDARRGRHVPDRRGDAVGGPEPLVGGRPDPLGLGGLAGDRGNPGHVPPQAVAFGRPAGRADHRADDARRKPPGDPFPRRPPPRGRPPRRRASDPPRRRGADPLVRDHRRNRLRRAADQRRHPDPAVRRDPGHLHAGRRTAGDGHLAGRDAAPVPAGSPGPPRLASRGSRRR